MFHTFFHVEDARFDPETLSYTVHFAPVVTDNFRLLIERTAAKVTPQSWLAELAQLEVFGTDAAEGRHCGCTETPRRRASSVHVTAWLRRSLFRRSRTWAAAWRSARRGTGWCWIKRSRASCRSRWIRSGKASWA